MVSEPVSPRCTLLVWRTRHSRGSVGLRGEQGTACPWPACSAVPAGFSVGPGDTRHPKASLPAGGTGLSPEEWTDESWSPHRTWHPVTIFFLSFSISLWVGAPEDGSACLLDLTFRSHLFQGPPPVPWPGTQGSGGVPGSLTFPPLTCGSSCFAGAAGCVATLLHDAAMNPAEGNDGPGLLGRGESGSARASWLPSVAQRVLLLLA